MLFISHVHLFICIVYIFRTFYDDFMTFYILSMHTRHSAHATAMHHSQSQSAGSHLTFSPQHKSRTHHCQNTHWSEVVSGEWAAVVAGDSRWRRVWGNYRGPHDFRTAVQCCAVLRACAALRSTSGQRRHAEGMR